MNKMITNQISCQRKIYTKRYLNGQLAVFVHNYSGEPMAELSIMHNLVELAPNEFILKDYSENNEIAKEFIYSELIIPTNRFILIGSHICPICQIES